MCVLEHQTPIPRAVGDITKQCLQFLLCMYCNQIKIGKWCFINGKYIICYSIEITKWIIIYVVFLAKKKKTFVDNFHWNFIMERYFRRNNFMFKSTISFWIFVNKKIYTTRLIYFAGTDVTIVTYMELRYKFKHLCFYYQIIFNAHLIFHISRSNILKHSKKEWDIRPKKTQ